jgi:FKBP-type peptidyl-prolyl cis-trans isomerase
MRYRTAALCLFLTLACLAVRLATADPAATQSSDNTVTTPSGLKIIETHPSDDAAKAGDQVWVHYVGKLQDGTEFDNSYKRGEPIPLTLGAGSVIKGWEEGLLGMKVGEKRQLIIPPDLAYGADGRPPTIPANSTLVFDVELVGLKR